MKMTNYKSILTELIKNKETWRQLKPELSKFNVHSVDTGEKDTRAGKIFEVFTKYYFLASPTEKDNYRNVWLFEDTPLEVRKKLNLGNQDYGVDLILQDLEDQYFVVQCKYKNDETSKLNWSADKIANLFAFCPSADGYIVFSNAIDLDQVSKTRHDNFTFYGVANLNEIDKDTLCSIYSLLTENHLTERKLFNPLPHQEIAIQECAQWFTEGKESRGQLILPCGAGKTFTALWIKERIESKNTLVLVPSLALLRQIKNEWSKQRKSVYQYLCVCSETDIDKDATDTLVTHTYEVDTRVTTNAEHVKSFLSKPFDEKVIFSSYHSLPVVAEAIKDSNFEFDLTFCDEAHKTAGVGKNKFSLVHDNNLVPSKYRLYATATPRIVKEILKKKLGDDLKYAYDMNDPNTFGYEFHRMTFKDAIEQDILVDYKIVAIGVNSDELKDYIEQRRFIDKKLSIDEMANNYALEHVMEKYNANHGLTFHSRVKLAQEFADRHGQLFTSTKTFSVNGEQPTSYRNLVLEEFKNSEKAIVSNARCLTEGVDVPTIDLVYFCDPKNSKVDIVQAVGRALRKKEGKELGLIVVPIYHSKKDEVENSISTGSFKNLLQVIRSLCDQDERLQDEINFLAFGKGKRKSSKIDIISSGFVEEQDKIILDGFEEKLKNSLFDQIIEKTSNNWDLWYLNLKNYLDAGKDYPSRKDDKDLYNWIAKQRNRKKNGTLKNEELRKLNSIGFVWNVVEWKWEGMFSIFQKYSSENVFPPCKGIDDDELVKWHKYQHSCIRDNKIISSEQKKRFLAIDNKFEGPSSRKKWIEPYRELVNFRLENPDKWPQYERDNTKSIESKLYIFCQTMRKRYREDDLGNYWFEKMTSIDFNFEGKTDNWTQYWQEIKNLLENRNSISVEEIGNNAYSWILRHRKKYDEEKLSKYHTKKIQELNLDRFFETWEQKFEKVKEWVDVYGKLPTRITQKDFNSWLVSQRSVFSNNRLSNEQVKSLRSIGYDLNPKGIEKNEQKWFERLNQYQEFVENNKKEPSYFSKGLEKTLYLWAAAQRAVKAGNARKRKPLTKKREQALDSIGFKWVGEGNKGENSWVENLEELAKHINANGLLVLPSTIDGNRNVLYTWWINQKIAYEKGKLTDDRVKAFQKIGIDLTLIKNNSKRDGFTRWANKVNEIAEFIRETGRYPKVGKDKKQGNLYQSLARTKRAYRNNELTEKQLELLAHLNIELD
jgi:superfamily II DNA or RNA helicase